MAKTIFSLKRNDVEAALEFWRERLLADAWTRDDARALLRLQDNPVDLLAAMDLAAAGDSHLQAALDRFAAREEGK
jgi:hypothetical protein